MQKMLKKSKFRSRLREEGSRRSAEREELAKARRTILFLKEKLGMKI